MEPRSIDWAGRFEEHAFASEVLQGNPLGDPHERPLWVYLPPGYHDDASGSRRFASVYVIQGLTGQVDAWRNRPAFRRNFPELMDQAFGSGECPPAVPRRGSSSPLPAASSRASPAGRRRSAR